MGVFEELIISNMTNIYENGFIIDFMLKFRPLNFTLKIQILQNLGILGYDVNEIVAETVNRPYIRSIDLSDISINVSSNLSLVSNYYYYETEMYNNMMKDNLLT